MKLKFLVVGTSRSGTVFAARLLTSIGIPCSHEMIFDYRGIDYAVKRMNGEESFELSWVSRAGYKDGKWKEHDVWLPNPNEVIAESSYMAMPYLGHDLLKDTKIIHIVRDPIKVVNSHCHHIDMFNIVDGCNAYEEFVYQHVPELKANMPQCDRVALFWIRWNQMAEKSKIDYLYKIEDGTSGVMKLLDKEGPHFCDTTINAIKFNQTSKDRFLPNKIQSTVIRDEFIAMGRRYGYAMRSEYLLI